MAVAVGAVLGDHFDAGEPRDHRAGVTLRQGEIGNILRDAGGLARLGLHFAHYQDDRRAEEGQPQHSDQEAGQNGASMIASAICTALIDNTKPSVRGLGYSAGVVTSSDNPHRWVGRIISLFRAVMRSGLQLILSA